MKAITMLLLETPSSQIECIGHDPDTGTLAVRFHAKQGARPLYHYAGVPPQVFADFRTSPSPGSYLAKVIKPTYPATKVDEASGTEQIHDQTT